MAKKRLNKKLTIIGSGLLAVLILAAIVIFLRLGQNPEDFIRDAEAALSLPEKDYEVATKAYGQAFRYAKDKELRIEILFRLAEIYEETKDWPKVAGCWTKIVTIDTSNVRARRALLDYSYQMADAGNWGVWRTVEQNASELIDKELDNSAYVYLLKGRAILELAEQGQTSNLEKSIQEAIDYLEKARELEPNNVDVYLYLARTAHIKGKIYSDQGILGAKEQAAKEAREILKQGIENAPEQPQAHINYLGEKYRTDEPNEQIYDNFEAELIALTKRFPDSAAIYFALTKLNETDIRDIDKAISFIEKACELENGNVTYALFAANLYYRRYSVYNDTADIHKAIDFAEKALTFPQSQDVPGPRSRINHFNRFSLHSFLSDCYLEQAMMAEEAQKSRWIELSEKEVHEMSQLLGSGENPYTIMWQGRLALAKGQDRSFALSQLYTAYDQLVTASKGTTSSDHRADKQLGQLAYTLGNEYLRTNEIGAVANFFVTAINNYMYYSKPDCILNYAAISLILKRWPAAIEAIDYYEKYYPSNDRSDQIRIKAYIGNRLLEEAEKELAKMNPDDPNVVGLNFDLNQGKINQILLEIRQREQKAKETGVADNSYEPLKAELQELSTHQGQLLDKLFKVAPDSLDDSMVLNMCRYYITEGKYEEATRLIDKYLQHKPDSVPVKIYKKIMAEPDPENIPMERRMEISESVLKNIADPLQRNLALAQNYQSDNELDKAVELYEEVLATEPDNIGVIGSLFDIALSRNDMKEANKFAGIVREKNLDSCGGDYFAARIAIVSEDHEQALKKLDSCLKQRPVFSAAYLLRSRVNAILKKDADAIKDAQEAFDLNPLSGDIAKNRAFVLYQRDQKLGVNVSPEQKAQTREALIIAMSLNKTDFQLQSFYAEYISDTNPQDALAIRQQLQATVPSLENSMLLGGMAHKMAEEEFNRARKQALLDIAEDAYKKALGIDPTNEVALNVYSEFLRILGRQDEAKELLGQNEDVLWKYYLRNGQFEKAKEILAKLAQTQPSDANIVRGMVMLAQKEGDKESLIKYSDKLLAIHNTDDNQLLQIQAFLEIGLIDEAENKLKIFREKNPGNASSLFIDAWVTAKKGQLEKALELTNQALELQPNSPTQWRLKGQINMGLNNLKEAIDDFQKSKFMDDTPEVRVDLARAYLKSSRVEDAITELKMAIEKEQNPLGSRKLLEEVYINSNNADKLRAFYNECIKKFPDFGYWYTRTATMAMNEGDYQKALEFFQKAWNDSVQRFGGDAESLDGILQTLILSKQNEELLKYASDFIDGPFAPIAYSRMADAKFNLGDNKTAIEYYRKALEKAGANSNLIINILARMSQTVGSQEPLKWCSERLQTEPESLQINGIIAVVYEMNNEYNKAIKHLDKCVQIASTDNQPVYPYLARKSRLLQILYSKTSDKIYLDEAIKEYESMLGKQPNNISVLNNLAYLLIENSKEFDKALEYAQRAYKAMPNNPDIIDTYAYVLLKKGQYVKAEELMQMAIQLFEQNQVSAPTEAYEHLGMLKERLNKYTEAIKAYENALEAGKGRVTEETRQRLNAMISELSEKMQNGE